MWKFLSVCDNFAQGVKILHMVWKFHIFCEFFTQLRNCEKCEKSFNLQINRCISLLVNVTWNLTTVFSEEIYIKFWRICCNFFKMNLIWERIWERKIGEEFCAHHIQIFSSLRTSNVFFKILRYTSSENTVKKEVIICVYFFSLVYHLSTQSWITHLFEFLVQKLIWGKFFEFIWMF